MFRSNNDEIIVAKNSYYHIKIGSVVTIAAVASKKKQTTYVHKLIRVRHDLLWQNVINSY